MLLYLMTHNVRLNPLSTGKSVQTLGCASSLVQVRLNPLSTGKSVQTLDFNGTDSKQVS